MKIGIVFGAYCPMHQGHLDVIFRAKKECDKVLLFVCGCDGETDRGAGILPLDTRCRIIKKMFDNDEIIDVFETNDSKLGIDESGSDANWDIWVKYTTDTIQRIGVNCNQNEIVWYISEPEYKTKLMARGIFDKDIVLCSRDNPISGTECREHPVKNWRKIVKEFRPYFTKNILIVGPASEGKTTLCQDLGRYFNCPVSWEKGRDRIAETYKAETQLNVTDFIYNIYEQNKLNQWLLATSENGIFISDTDNLVTLMYAKEYVDRHLGPLTQEEYEHVLVPLVKAYRPHVYWDKVFILKPHGNAYVDDGVRDFSYSSDDDRMKFFNTICRLVSESGYPYEVITGNYYDNFIHVKKYIEELLKDE